MTNEERNKVISKIKKLLALAGSANEHEAALAAERAQAILAQYNLSIGEVEAVRDGDDQIAEDGEIKTNSFPWHRILASHVAKLYFCRYFYRTWRNPKGGNARSGHNTHHFIGAKHNIEVAKVMFVYLQETVERLAREEATKYVNAVGGSRSGFITSFTNECSHRLCIRILDRIAAAKKGEIKTEAGSNLPALASLYERTDQRLAVWEKDHYPNMKASASRAQITNWAGAAAGRAAGDKIGLDQQVGGRSKRKAIT